MRNQLEVISRLRAVARWMISILSITTLVLALPQSATSGSVDLSNPDVASIVQIAKDFSEAYKAGDLKRVIDVYSPDVIYMYQGEPNHEGRAVIEEMYRDFFSQYNAQVTVNIQEVRISGDMAFDRATFKVSASPKAGGETVVTEGRVFEVLRKENGKWKSFRVMVNNEK